MRIGALIGANPFFFFSFFLQQTGLNLWAPHGYCGTMLSAHIYSNTPPMQADNYQPHTHTTIFHYWGTACPVSVIEVQFLCWTNLHTSCFLEYSFCLKPMFWTSNYLILGLCISAKFPLSCLEELNSNVLLQISEFALVGCQPILPLISKIGVSFYLELFVISLGAYSCSLMKFFLSPLQVTPLEPLVWDSVQRYAGR